MTEIKVGNYVTLLPGIRYENYAMDYNAFYTRRFGPNPGDFSNEKLKSNTSSDNWFPQLQLRVKPTNWLDIRLTSTKSII